MGRARLHPDTCVRCQRHTISRSIWATLTKDQRRAHKACGVRQAGSRGLCTACFQWCLTHDDLDRYARANVEQPVDSAWHLCVRCGAGKRRADGLCLDCADVTHDLHELDRWVQPTHA